MKWIQTPDSSAISRFGYDEANRILSISYHDGETYDYLRVPAGVFKAMQDASSKGQFVTAHVKGLYAFRKVST